MRKLLRISAFVLCVVCFLMLAPKPAAYAQEWFEIGDGVIYIDGNPYTLSGIGNEAQPLGVIDPGGPSSIKNQISYSYAEGPGRTLIVHADVTQTVSVGGIEIAVVKQKTEWHYVYGESVEFISGTTTCSAMVSGALPWIEEESCEGNTYSAGYMVIYEGEIIDGTISTTCSVYGTIS